MEGDSLIVINGKIKKQLSTIVAIILLMLTGCSNTMGQETGNEPKAELDPVEIDNGVDFAEGSNFTEESIITAEDIVAVYQDIYDEAAQNNTLGSLDVIRRIVNRLGENGFSAVDNENQIDMVCPENIKQFCGKVEAQEEAEATLIVVISADSFIKYDFTTKDGNVEVVRSYYLYRGDDLGTVSTTNYPAYTWVYSKGAYLFFEEYHMPGYDGPSGHTAVRIEPLDEMCREYNRKYLMTIGYKLNNLFTSDWDEDNFQELNFYDLYEVLRQMKNGQYSVASLHEGINYEIPKSDFESVFQTFFRVDGQVLQQFTTYHEDTETYQYRTRGMFDFAPTPYSPYPEVISYEENQDGTIKLTVNAVWTEGNLENAFCHEVIIRPLENGGFQYVSNHVIPSEDNVEVTWYTERLSDDKWQEYYGGMQ